MYALVVTTDNWQLTTWLRGHSTRTQQIWIWTHTHTTFFYLLVLANIIIIETRALFSKNQKKSVSSKFATSLLIWFCSKFFLLHRKPRPVGCCVAARLLCFVHSPPLCSFFSIVRVRMWSRALDTVWWRGWYLDDNSTHDPGSTMWLLMFDQNESRQCS